MIFHITYHALRAFFIWNFEDSFYESTSKLPVEELVRVGLMYGNGYAQPQFIHKTFGDFFVADFILKSFRNPGLKDETLNLFLKVTMNKERDYRMINRFVDIALTPEDVLNYSDIEKNKSLVRTYIDKYHCCNFFQKLVSAGCINIIKVLSFGLHDDIDRLYGFWQGQIYDEESVFNYACRKQSVEFLG